VRDPREANLPSMWARSLDTYDSPTVLASIIVAT
jgi:hypothetical protein